MSGVSLSDFAYLIISTNVTQPRVRLFCEGGPALGINSRLTTRSVTTTSAMLPYRPSNATRPSRGSHVQSDREISWPTMSLKRV